MKGRQDPALALALLALAAALLFGLLAVFDRGPPGIDPDPPMPWPVTAEMTITPGGGVRSGARSARDQLRTRVRWASSGR